MALNFHCNTSITAFLALALLSVPLHRVAFSQANPTLSSKSAAAKAERSRAAASKTATHKTTASKPVAQRTAKSRTAASEDCHGDRTTAPRTVARRLRCAPAQRRGSRHDLHRSYSRPHFDHRREGSCFCTQSDRKQRTHVYRRSAPPPWPCRALYRQFLYRRTSPWATRPPAKIRLSAPRPSRRWAI